MKSTDTLYQLYTQYPQIVTDSRKATKGSIFFALKGNQFDGNSFAEKALEAGCNYAVVDDPQIAINERYVLVDDVLSALQNLARRHRVFLSHLPIIAITGSNGKTTTKELVKCVLSEKYKVYATSGNLNNHIGVPLTLLAIPADTQIAIIEMGANHPGEIKELCDIALPTHGIITNIGRAHLEGFGSIEGVIKTKRELYEHLDRHDGTIFYNENNELLVDVLQDTMVTKIGFGKTQCTGNIVSSSPYLHFLLNIHGETHDIQTQIVGAYNLENMLAAACIGYYFGVAPTRIAHALAQYTPQNNRSQIVKTAHNQLLVDYYNANPSSMKEALQSFFAQKQDHSMVILGDMFELGAAALEEHAAIVNMLLVHPEITTVLVGKQFYEVVRQHGSQIKVFATVEELQQWLQIQPPTNAFILLKGSRKMQLERLLEFL